MILKSLKPTLLKSIFNIWTDKQKPTNYVGVLEEYNDLHTKYKITRMLVHQGSHYKYLCSVLYKNSNQAGLVMDLVLSEVYQRMCWLFKMWNWFLSDARNFYVLPQPKHGLADQIQMVNKVNKIKLVRQSYRTKFIKSHSL